MFRDNMTEADAAPRARHPKERTPAMLMFTPLTVLRRWIRYRTNFAVLARLDDRTLYDIGINRADIAFVAKRATH
jgi:uncharacterized protein YjiS (DUF1127 family)